MRILVVSGMIAGLWAWPAPAQVQRLDPVQWSLAVEPAAAAPGAKVLAKLTASIEPGWHLYSPTTPPGPIQTTLEILENPAVAATRLLQPEPPKKFDPNFNNEQETFDGEAVFLFETSIAPGAANGETGLTAQVRYQACSDTQCLRPVTKTATATLLIDNGARAAAIEIPPGYVEVRAGEGEAPAPVSRQGQDEGLARFLLVAYGFGLAAVVTPCVFPMIPITMSFFLNRPSGSRADSIFQAALFGGGIIVLFSGLGLVITSILGPFGIVRIGSSPVVNGFIAAVFFAIGLSMLGAFEITLPSGLLTRLDQASQRGGILGTLLMGLTFSMTSFACVGPFMGTILAASVSSGGAQPLLGMASFATGLATPFFFLAVFPSYLKKLPRSGGWLPRVKVVLGFVILAAMVYYLSNVDRVMQLGVLTRERFLAAWVVLLAMPGLYLLGILRMEGVEPNERTGVTRALIGAAFLIFALSLIPGMFGGRLGDLDAYVPAASTDASGGLTAAHGQQWMKDDYRGALERGRQENKLVLVTFTGYACTNCKWMKANMFTRPEIAAATADYILVELYTDGSDAATPENQQLQETKFQTVAIPYYAIVDADERVLATFDGLTKNTAGFLAFLNAPKS